MAKSCSFKTLTCAILFLYVNCCHNLLKLSTISGEQLFLHGSIVFSPLFTINYFKIVTIKVVIQSFIPEISLEKYTPWAVSQQQYEPKIR